MAQPYHLTLLSVFSYLLLTGLVAAHLSGENKVGKIVTMTVQYPASGSPPGEKTTISAHYVDENGGGDRRFNLDCDDNEPKFLAKITIDLQPRFRHEVPYHDPGGDTRREGVSIRERNLKC
ncbi:hypothetical protein ACQJBY_005260 [Aegilops geniculata]